MATSLNGNDLMKRKALWEQEETKFGPPHFAIAHCTKNQSLKVNLKTITLTSLFEGEDDDPIPEELED